MKDKDMKDFYNIARKYGFIDFFKTWQWRKQDLTQASEKIFDPKNFIVKHNK